MNLRKFYLAILVILTQSSFSQEGLPVYSDYLSDNYYLLHPSMAGAANCTKVRLTARQQWFGVQDAPALQTLSINGSLGDRSGGGLIVFNDKNGYHSQTGMKLTYAHHLMFSRDQVDLNQLSFGMSAGFVQSQLDETDFLINNPSYDPIINGTIVQSASYFNVDIGASYNFLDFYVHATVKNALASNRKLYTDREPVNLRRFILNSGYTFGDADKILWEPSFMFQLVTQTQEKTIDLNVKAYKNLDFGMLWGGISYRRSLDGAQYVEGQSIGDQKLQYITPILGVNFKNYMLSYTYSQLLGNVKFDSAGFHQLTLGINLFCKPEKYHCNCPAIN
ncbi:MAG: type IX secretion system membrane protein PorP/SprF [Flavobacterium sp.]|jgi:type IX secretion system PorP/SprF family membrane protein|uniref:PorP/SprF family type IX secretion system membrane protein n=1 Tax=Flavobacterium sp. TaxID=239 RepID=UPI002C27B7B3|nr:type IX secretion system membrane protein PorP/SprF [Flavobacterium sp.]MCA0348864.1 type IX secretion system membrane protein PorP/SprF [Bacteroidota bacterium]HQA74097.1 type IX secretion system membrane protein PorP/SprF [Flavobacterium sp.]